MTTGEIVMLLGFLALTGVMIWLAIEFRGMKAELRSRAGINNETIKMQLQAYERLTLFIERCGLKNLVGRLSPEGLNVAQLQAVFVQTIKTEYEYNISQQVYISPELWRAITNMKEQNIYIVNQLSSGLSPDASGAMLSKAILELVINNEKADLYNIVLDALQFEAKKIM
jgi:hypothetical protein